MSFTLPENAGYPWVRELLRQSVERDRAAGGDRAIVAEFHERLAAEHDTTTCESGAPCDACGQPWPCGMIRSILAPD